MMNPPGKCVCTPDRIITLILLTFKFILNALWARVFFISTNYNTKL